MGGPLPFDPRPLMSQKLQRNVFDLENQQIDSFVEIRNDSALHSYLNKQESVPPSTTFLMAQLLSSLSCSLT